MDEGKQIQAVLVRPLVWDYLGHDNWRAALPLFGSVRIETYGHGHTINWSVPGFSDEFIKGIWSTADAAKVAAQAEFDKRILACLPAHIVRCVNAHDELVAALKMLRGQYVLFVGPDDDIANVVLKEVGAALAKAGA